VDLLAQLFVETGDVNYIYNQGRCYEQNGKFGEAILRFREFFESPRVCRLRKRPRSMAILPSARP